MKTRLLEILLVGSLVAGAVVIAKHFPKVAPLAPIREVQSVSADLNVNTTIRLVHDGRTFCSGSVIKPHLIVTAGHCAAIVANDFGLVEIRRRDNKPTFIYAQALTASPQLDNGLLLGDFSKFKVNKFEENPYKLDRAIHTAPFLTVCGFPMGGDLYCLKATPSGTHDFQYLIDRQLFPGMSGGPDMLPDGTVIGVNSAVSGEYSLLAPLVNITSQVEIPK